MSTQKLITKKEFVDKYKDVEFKFVGYWKFSFHYQAVTEDGLLEAVFGETSNDIYRTEFLPVQSLSDLMDQGAGLSFYAIEKKDTNTQTTTAMTREEIIEKYKDVKLKFDYYYKCLFHYSGVAEDGTSINGSFGGSSYDIYDAEFLSVESLENLVNECEEVYDLSVKKP